MSDVSHIRCDRVPLLKQRPVGILVVGPPGCGKGTVGKALKECPGIVHCSSGDLIRTAMSQNRLQPCVSSGVTRGALVDDDILWGLLDSFLASPSASARAGAPLPVIIVDGIPRCRSQVADLATRIDVRGVVYLECIDSQVLEDRLQLRSVLEARADDKSAATLEARLRLFSEETLPLLDEYHANIVHRIDARQASTKVLSDVSDVVHRIQKSLKSDVLAVVTHPN